MSNGADNGLYIPMSARFMDEITLGLHRDVEEYKKRCAALEEQLKQAQLQIIDLTYKLNRPVK